MGTQWSEQNPGAGSTGSVINLATHLQKVSSLLEYTQSDVQKSLEIFPKEWSGLAATAAQTQIQQLQSRTEALGEAGKQAQGKLRAYAAEVKTIQTLASEQILLRDSAQKRVESISRELRGQVSPPMAASPAKRQPLEADLKEASDATNAAVQRLKELAQRRQTADDTLLAALRAAIAQTWDVAPEQYPSNRSLIQTDSYEYDIEDPLGVSVKDYTAKELMDLFKKYPSRIFSFKIKGDAPRFQDGAIFELSNTLPIEGTGVDEGTVTITTTDTSVKFTVISDEYFDGPGSTIEFSIVEKGGEFYLRKIADAKQAEFFVAVGVRAGFVRGVWQDQANNFKEVISEYGKRRG